MSIVRIVGIANVCLVFLLSGCGGVEPEPGSESPGVPSSSTSSAVSSTSANDNEPPVVGLPEQSSSSESSASSLASSATSSSGTIVISPANPDEAVTEGPEGFVYCVNEVEWVHRATPSVCEFEGTRTIAYGANGQFNYAVASGSHVCNNSSIEDPIVGTRKACFVSEALADPADGLPGSSAAARSSSSQVSSAPSSSSSVASSSASSAATQDDSAFVCDAPRPVELSSNYAERCSGCHGDTGGGGAGYRLIDRHFESFAAFEHAVRGGPGWMPAFGADVYSDAAMRNDFAHFTHGNLCGQPDDQPVAIASCEASEGLLEPQLRRLTQTEMVNTITTVFGNHFDPSIWPDLGDALPTIGMSNIASTLQVDSVNLERIHATVSAIVDQLLSTTAANCINGSGNQCIDNLLVEYAPQLWRRPMTDIELLDLTDALSNVRAENGSREQQAEFIFRSLLMSPNFLFRMELGELQGQALHLDSYEIASLLSYALWASPPDSILYALADSDRLTDQAVIDEQVERMMADPRFQGAMVDFLKDFLKLDRVLTVEKISDLDFTDAQRRDLLTSAELMLADNVADLDQDLMSVFSGHEFYVNNTIAPLFGLDSSQFGSELRLTSINREERSGILTHPAFLAVHATAGTSGIVKRGVFALEQMLCVHLGDPPDDLTEAPLPPDVDPETTSTRVLLQLQHSHQPACVGCHQAIDPAGFGFESFDVLGRFQTVEKGNVPIDSSGTLSSVLNEPLVFANHIEYVEGLVQTPEMRSCVSRRMLESFSGQNISANACELDQLNHHINQNDTTIRGLIKSLTQVESVRLRNL